MALSFKPLVVDKFLFANEQEITIMTVCNHETYGITVSDTDALLTSQIRLGGRGSGYNMSFVWDRTHSLWIIFSCLFYFTSQINFTEKSDDQNFKSRLINVRKKWLQFYIRGNEKCIYVMELDSFWQDENLQFGFLPDSTPANWRRQSLLLNCDHCLGVPKIWKRHKFVWAKLLFIIKYIIQQILLESRKYGIWK